MKVPKDMPDTLREEERAATYLLHHQAAPRLRPVISKGRWEGQALGAQGRKHHAGHGGSVTFSNVGLLSL